VCILWVYDDIMLEECLLLTYVDCGLRALVKQDLNFSVEGSSPAVST